LQVVEPVAVAVAVVEQVDIEHLFQVEQKQV